MVTTTGTGPTAWGGVTKLTWVPLTWVNGTEAPSTVRSVAPARFVPSTTTVVPPDAGPLFGVSDAATGAGT